MNISDKKRLLTVPVLPVRNTIVFPIFAIPITVGRQKSINALNKAMEKDNLIAILTQKDQEIEDPHKDDLYQVGSLCKVIKRISLGQDRFNVILQGISRMRVFSYLHFSPFIMARIMVLEDDNKESPEVEAIVLSIKTLAQKFINLSPNIPEEASLIIKGIDTSSSLMDIVATNLNISIEEKQQLLETTDLKKRGTAILRYLEKEVQILELSKKIQNEAKGEMDKMQREFFLREQMKAIQRELGDSDERNEEFEELKKQIEQSLMPEEVKKVASKELKRLAKMPQGAAEYTVSRTYLDWLIEMPWGIYTEDNLDINEVERILNEDHYGLEKVKKRILEYLAVRKLKPDMKGPILCFVGPPGVGKTSLGSSIARAMGRKFVRIALGGVKDESEIRGHRRTYIGSMPGKIIKGLKKAGTSNPVFVIDEVDKLGMDYRGDPSSALLEVFDPELNNTFLDHYLDVPFDLSKVFFIATANFIDPIPPALKDRMEIIEIPGYSEEEKLNIALYHLIPKQIENHGLSPEKIEFLEPAIRLMINNYTREAGVRNIEREIGAVCRYVAKEVATGKSEKTIITEEAVEKILGPQKFFLDIAERIQIPGIAVGLAWTPTGGDIIFIESTWMKGSGKLILTGHLGDVMKESAQAALSFLRSKALEFDIDESVFKDIDIHIHIPAGAIPKDGPSAGIAILVSLFSLFMKRPVRGDVSMTGEITLRGNLLPVGGIKEKVLAARRAGINTVILPEKNRKDLQDLPPNLLKEMNFLFVSRMEEVIKLAIDMDTTPLRENEPPKEPLKKKKEGKEGSTNEYIIEA